MPELVLTVAAYKGLPPREAKHFRLSDGSCILGRRSGCDLELPDTECVVSGQHARVELKGQCFVVTDVSTNGTYINSTQTPIGPNEAVPLTDGDRLHIGPYELTVSIAAAPPAATSAWTGLELTGQQSSRGDLAPEPSRHSDIIDLLSNDTASVRAAVGMGGGAFGEDQFAEVPGLQARSDSPTPSTVEPSRPSVEHVHFTLPTNTSAKAAAEPRDSADLGQERQPWRMPGVPEDYDLLSDAFGPEQDAPEQFPGVAEDSSKESETAQQQVEPVPEQLPGPVLDELRTAPQKPPGHITGRYEHEGRDTRAVGEIPASTRVTLTSSELNAFLDGLGVANLPPGVDRVALMQKSGALLRQMTEGLMAVMRARAAFKSELRLEVTTIRSRANNPFQFCVDAEDALDRLLWRPTPGFLDPEIAASKAFDDIQAHEMAMMAGLRAALSALVAHFEPTRLQRRVDSQKPIDRFLPGAQKAKCWEQFVAAFDEVADDASEDFMRVFGEAFNQAYEDQVQRLAKARTQDQSSR